MLNRKKLTPFIGAITLALALTVAPATNIQAATASKPAVGICTTQSTPLNIRASASTSSSIVAKLPKSAYIEIIGTSGDYYKVIYDTKGSVGYCHKSYISIQNETYGTVTTKGGTMNMRSGASTSSSIIAKLPNKTVLPIISKVNSSWYKVVYGKTVGYVHSDYFKTGSSSSSTTTTSSSRTEIVNYAKTFLGTYYQWGGNYPTNGYGLDCSHFTYQVMKKFGLMNSYMTSANQAAWATPITRSQLQPGDLVFYKSSSTGAVVHVAIYIGNGQVIGANGGDSSVTTSSIAKSKNAMVKIQSIDYDSRSKSYGRVPGLR